MSVFFDNSAGGSAGVTNTLTLASFALANQPDRYLLVAVSLIGGVAADVSSITWNGSENLSEIGDVTQGTDDRLIIWALKNPSPGTADIVVTLTANPGDGFAVIASSWYGVGSVGTVRSTQAATGTSHWVASDGGRAGGVVVGLHARGLTGAAVNSLADVNGIAEWIASGALSVATAQTSRTPAAPTGALRGDLEIAHCSSENNATHSVSGSGWFKIGQTNSGASFTVSHYYRIHDGTNVDPVISWTGSVDASARRYLFRDTRAKASVAAPVAYHGTVGTGTVSPHTSTGANTTENDVLAAYIDICNANTAMAAETSWTERVDSGSATGPIRSYLADREMATSGSATGNISETGGAAAYVQQQFEIYNADNGDQINVREVESFAGDFASLSVSYENMDVYNALGWNGTGGTTGALISFAVPLRPASLPPLAANDSFLTQMLPNW